jgi:hypothetical protein
MTKRDLFLDAILEKPIWQLTSDDLEALSEQERIWAINHMSYMKDEGILALVLANPKGTKYKTVWEDNRWKLVPAPMLDAHDAADALRDLIREEFDNAVRKIAEVISAANGERGDKK